MDLLKRMLPLAAGALAAVALAGCSVAVEPSPELPPILEPPILEPTPVVAPASSGLVTISWFVAGRSDAGLCVAYGATNLELVVYDARGAVVTREYAPCGDFSIRLALPAGTYTAEVTLVGRSNEAITVTKPLDAIDVVPGTDLAISVDFPSSSMI